MKARLLFANHALLFLCASMYLGTGGSLLLFSFPIAPELTVDTYYAQFVTQVHAATEFFTPMTKLMLVLCVVMLIAEWRQPTRRVPIVVLLAVIAATVLTTKGIFPLNEKMSAHIKDPARLTVVLGEWMQLDRLRVAFWCVQWAALQKLGAAALVAWGVSQGVFAPLALAVATFDAASGLLFLDLRRRGG